jgi:sugar/nucleoside kinase (ribokinase family)
MREDSITPLLERAPAPARTGASGVIVVDGERALLTFLGCSGGMTAASAPPDSTAGAALLHATCVLTWGFMAQHPGHLALALSVGEARRRARRHDFALNLGSVQACSGASALGVAALARLSSVGAGKLQEAEALAAACGFAVDTNDESGDGGGRVAQLAQCLADKLFDAPDAHHEQAAQERVVVLTDGARPTAVARAGRALPAALIPIADDVQVRAADVVDDTGAGDAFLGGLLAARARAMGLEEAVRAGHWAAAHVVRRRGATFDRGVACPLLARL